MSFIEKRLPVDVAPGVAVSPGFSTSIKQLRGGGEYRNAQWAEPLREFSLAYNARDTASVAELQRFLLTVYGSLYGFRAKDYSDHTVVDGPVGSGDGFTYWFRLYKKYDTFTRRITKPALVEPTVKIDGVVIDSDDFFFDHANGTVVFITAPAYGAIITWSGEFDVPVRFDNDAFTVIMDTDDIGRASSVGLMELRMPERIDEAEYAEKREFYAMYPRSEMELFFTALDNHINVQWPGTEL